MLFYVIIIVLYCIYLASACLLNETIRINSLVHLFTCSQQVTHPQDPQHFRDGRVCRIPRTSHWASTSLTLIQRPLIQRRNNVVCPVGW